RFREHFKVVAAMCMFLDNWCCRGIAAHDQDTTIWKKFQNLSRRFASILIAKIEDAGEERIRLEFACRLNGVVMCCNSLGTEACLCKHDAERIYDYTLIVQDQDTSGHRCHTSPTSSLDSREDSRGCSFRPGRSSRAVAVRCSSWCLIR